VRLTNAKPARNEITETLFDFLILVLRNLNPHPLERSQRVDILREADGSRGMSGSVYEFKFYELDLLAMLFAVKRALIRDEKTSSFRSFPAIYLSNLVNNS
jgi:hypothetical protein